jgi:NAD+ kinase
MDASQDLRIAGVHSGTDIARERHAEMARRYPLVPPEQCDVLVALGGDGHLLHCLHDFLELDKPIFGMNCGTVGFLMNECRCEDLVARIRGAVEQPIRPLLLEAELLDGRTEEALAFNEVTAFRHTSQSVNARILVDGVVRMEKFVGDGLIVATSAGSTAYNYSAHGPILPLESELLALTPVSPFRPRRWRGALLPQDARIRIENLDPGKRRMNATADFHELADVRAVEVRAHPDLVRRLLFDPGHSLEERILAEQFAF